MLQSFARRTFLKKSSTSKPENSTDSIGSNASSSSKLDEPQASSTTQDVESSRDRTEAKPRAALHPRVFPVHAQRTRLRDTTSAQQKGKQTDKARLPRNRIRPRPANLSVFSSPPIDNSLFFANDFMLGAGMVILQPSSGKVVLVYDTKAKYWFLPRGRKDVGESTEQTALREAYEESGYRVEFLPVFIPTNAPGPPTVPMEHQRAYGLPSTEPIYISSTYWSRRRPAQVVDTDGGLYLTFWYVGQIGPDAVPEENTGMPDEMSYKSHLLDIETALEHLAQWPDQREYEVVRVAYQLWQDTVAWEVEGTDAQGSAPLDAAAAWEVPQGQTDASPEQT